MGVVHFFLREMDDARLLELFYGGVLFAKSVAILTTRPIVIGLRWLEFAWTMFREGIASCAA